MSAAQEKPVKVVVRHKSAGLRAGDVVEVSAADAAYLIANGNATAYCEPKSKKD